LFILLQNCVQRHKGQHRTRVRITNVILTQSQHDNGHNSHLQVRHTATILIHLDKVHNFPRAEM